MQPALGVQTAACALIALGLLAPSFAHAQPVRLDLDSADALLAAGFTLEEDKPQSSFGGGQLRIETALGYSEWLLRTDAGDPEATSGWLVPRSTARGYRIELRMQLVSRDCGNDSMGPGLWVDEDSASYRLYVLPDALHLASNVSFRVPLTTTDALHTYRVEGMGAGRVRVFVDGAEVLDEQLAVAGSGGALMFGDLGGCDSAESIWDYVEYDTFAPGGAAGDEDGDGVDDADDTCVLLADSSQLDADDDGAGDACDKCPDDPENDSDHDNLCAGDDPCPDDTRNDQDANGVCDVEQCAMFENEASPVPWPPMPGTCSAPCQCPFVGIDPVGPPDNFGGAGGGAAGMAGSVGAAGGSGSAGGTGVGVVGAAGDGSSAAGRGDTSRAGTGPGSAAGMNAAEADMGSSGGCAVRPARGHGMRTALALSALALLFIRRRCRA